VRITESAIHAAVFLSYRYITDHRLPDKAIDLIDEAASLIVEQEAMKRANNPLAKNEEGKLEGPIAQIKEDLSVLKHQWDREKKIIDSLKEKKRPTGKISLSGRRSGKKSGLQPISRAALYLNPRSSKRD